MDWEDDEEDQLEALGKKNIIHYTSYTVGWLAGQSY